MTSSPTRQPLNADLVCEGGGVKGIGLVGAAHELIAAGYTNVEQLDGQQDDIDLRRYLGLSKPVFTHVVRVAGLVKKAKAASTAVPAAELAGVTLLQKLLDEGVRRSADVHTDWKSESKRVTDLAAELKKRRLDAPTASSIVEWMKAFAK